MVRILTGTLVEAGMGKRDIVSMTELLKAKNRESAGFVAPACGLLLKKSDMNNRNNQGNAPAFFA